MPQLLFLSLIIFLLLALALIIHGGEIFAPSCSMCAGFFICMIATIINFDLYRVNLHWNTIAVISSGLFTFIFVDFFVSVAASFQEHRILGRTWQEIASEERKAIRIQSLNCDKTIIRFLIAVVVLNIFLYLRTVFLIVQHSGRVVNGWAETMNAFRSLVSYGRGDEEVPFLIRQSYSMLTFLGYVCACLIAHQFYFLKKVDRLLGILCLAALALSVMDANRGTFVRILITPVVYYDMLQYWDTGKGIKCKLSTIFKLLGAMLLIFALFVFLKMIVGRIDNTSPIHYITYYIGTSIYNLDDFLQGYHSKPELWGKETFYGFYHGLYVITRNPQFNYIEHKEFLFINGASSGNIYTVFRAYIHDFGYFGMYILIALSSLIINAFYHSLRSHVWKSTGIGYVKEFPLYASFYLEIFFSFFADYFFSKLIAFRIIKMALMFWFWELLLLRVKYNVKRGKRSYETRLVAYRSGL